MKMQDGMVESAVSNTNTPSNPNNASQATPFATSASLNAAKCLLTTKYGVFSPLEVGDRYVAFLLRNDRTLNTLYAHVLRDHVVIARQRYLRDGENFCGGQEQEGGSGSKDEMEKGREDEQGGEGPKGGNGDVEKGVDDNVSDFGKGFMLMVNMVCGTKFSRGQDLNTISGLEGNIGGTRSRRFNGSIVIDAHRLTFLDPVMANITLRNPDTLMELMGDATAQAMKVVRNRMEVAVEGAVERLEQCVESSGRKVKELKHADRDDNKQSSDFQQKVHEMEQHHKSHKTQLKDLKILLKTLHYTQRRYNPQPLHARLVHLPPHPQFCKPTLSSISSSDVGSVVQISGTCIRVGPVKMMETSRQYICLGKGCGQRFSVNADFGTTNNALFAPTVCPFLNDGCKSTSFALVPDGGERTDYQEIKVQESVEAMSSCGKRVGTVPRSILVKVNDDLVDKCNPGDELVVVGSLHAEWQQGSTSLGNGVEMMVGMCMTAHSIRLLNNENEEEDMAGLGMGSADAIVGLSTLSGLMMGSGSAREKLRKEFDAFWADAKSKKHFIAARDYIVRAVCPKLYGMHAIKLGLLLVLIGGASVQSQEDDPNHLDGDLNDSPNIGAKDMAESEDESKPVAFKFDGCESDDNDNSAQKHKKRKKSSLRRQGGKPITSNRRIQSHILMIGDPGTGKSQFLRFAAAIAPRSVLTTGTGSSTAGLTCAAVRDQSAGSKKNEFSLEAGALALADRGVCCIDEFGCMSKEDRTSIHEAMEQQTISVAKAGIVCKLNARASVVAVMNPSSGVYDETQSVEQNSRLGTALLSRFDLIFVMLDQADEQRDENIADFLLQQAIIPGSAYDRPETEALFEDDKIYGHWSMEKLRAYISTVREKFHPVLSEEASSLLEAYYTSSRQSKHEMSLPITVRFLESLIRLSQAHARLMYRNVVQLQDAVAVILLMECTAASSQGLFGSGSSPDGICFNSNPIDSEFRPYDDADRMFYDESQDLLQKYFVAKPNEIRPHRVAEKQQRCGTSRGVFGQRSPPFPSSNPYKESFGMSQTDQFGRQHMMSQSQYRHSQTPMQNRQTPHRNFQRDLYGERPRNKNFCPPSSASSTSRDNDNDNSDDNDNEKNFFSGFTRSNDYILSQMDRGFENTHHERTRVISLSHQNNPRHVDLGNNGFKPNNTENFQIASLTRHNNQTPSAINQGKLENGESELIRPNSVPRQNGIPFTPNMQHLPSNPQSAERKRSKKRRSAD